MQRESWSPKVKEGEKWDPFVLLLIDVQRDFWTDEMAKAFPDYEEHVAGLLDFCRHQKIDIVHLRAEFRRDKSDWMAKYRFLEQIPCIEGTKGAEVFPFAKEAPGEKVLIKKTFDGFHNPELQSYLQENNKQFVLAAGLVTSVCVLLTAANAAQRGYLVGLVEDCCADEPDSHQHTLEKYPFIFFRTTADQIASSRERWVAALDVVAGDS